MRPDISKMFRLTREIIEVKYKENPIFIMSNKKNKGEWYIVEDTDTSMPPHLLSSEEYDLTDDETASIKIAGKNEITAYCMWRNFNKPDGWEAYGYEN